MVDLMAGLRALLQQADAEVTPPADPPAPTEPTPVVTYPPDPATPGPPPVEANPPAGITQQWIGAIEAQAMATAAAEQAAAAVRAEFARASQPTAPVTPPAQSTPILPITAAMTADERVAAVDRFMADNAGKPLHELRITETRTLDF